MSTIQLLCKSENNMNNTNVFQESGQTIKEETIRLKREDGGGQITIIQAMAQPQQNIQQQPQPIMDHDEKKMRRQIANSNERRRMQSINAGFQSLRQLLPHHEGEKLSKAAILQQTAEYIDRLEHEKQQLQATVQHLQRIVDSMGGGNNNNNNNNANECPQIIQQITSSPSTVAIKKRKLDQAMTAISDSSDEGLGSMSPEPVTQMIFSSGANSAGQTKHLATTTTTASVAPMTASVATINVKDYVNLQNQMETERRHRMQLEEQLKQLEMQVYHNQPKYPQQIHQEIVDEIDGGNHSGGEEKIILRPSEDGSIHYITTTNATVVPQGYVVVSTSTPGTSPKHMTLVNEDDDNSRTLSSDELHKEDEVKFVVRKMSPKHHHQQSVHLRIPSILEQAIKAEPKVEVERINSPICIMPTMIESNNTNTSTSVRTTYPNNNHQRPNLETIVEAIRHLEGDAFDMDEETSTASLTTSNSGVKINTQEAPLALTTSRQIQNIQNGQVVVKEPFKFRQSATSQATGLPQFVSVPLQVQQQQQSRPGVIVVKQSS